MNRAVVSGVFTTSAIIPAIDYDSMSLQLQVEDVNRSVTVSGTDSVVAASHTWTFANAGFTNDYIGGTIKVTGATQSNNNNAVQIISVTNPTTAVSNGTQTNETFNNGNTTLVITKKPLTGSWILEGSNNWFANNLTGGSAGGGLWNKVDSLFAPTVNTFLASGVQYTQTSTCDFNAFKITASGVSGNGLTTVYVCAKGTF